MLNYTLKPYSREMQNDSTNLSQKYLELEEKPKQEWLNWQEKYLILCKYEWQYWSRKEHHCHIMGKSNLHMAISAGSIAVNNYSEVQFSNDFLLKKKV